MPPTCFTSAMSIRSTGLGEELRQYLLSVTASEPELLAQLREETAQHPQGRMQICPEAKDR